MKNGSASLGSSSQLWRDFSCSSPGRRDEAGARDEACSPSPPAPGFSGGEAEEPRSCQRLSAVTQRRPSAAVVTQLQGSFRLSCCGVARWPGNYPLNKNAGPSGETSQLEMGADSGIFIPLTFAFGKSDQKCVQFSIIPRFVFLQLPVKGNTVDFCTSSCG